MFYADFVLSKKGPLSKVWLAAHWEKKLSKAQIYETDVDEAVSEIMRPSQKLALRTTGHLLLGIVRVYSRKTKYLLADCNEAFLKIKLAFRSIDQPNPVLPTFTIQDIYGEFGDNILPEFDEEELNHAPICQSRIDDITLKEDLPQKFDFAIGGGDDDDDFGEIAAGVGPEDYQRLMDDCNIDIEMELARNATSTTSSLFGREREPTPFLNDAHAPGNVIFGDDDFAAGNEEHNDEDDHNFQSSSGIDTNHLMPMEDMDYEDNHQMHNGAVTPIRAETPASFRPISPTSSIAPSVVATEQEDTVESYYERQAKRRAEQQQLNMKRRRVDEIKMVSGDEMKSNMADYSDTLNRLDLAPPSREDMMRKKRGMMEFLHHNPGMIGTGKSKLFIRNYQNNLIITKHENAEQKEENIKNLLGLRDIGEEEMQLEQQEMEMNHQDDNLFADDFEEVAPLDFDQLDMMDNQPIIDDLLDDDVPAHNPLSPFIIQPDEEDMSPNEKRKKREEDKEEQDVDDDNRWSKRTHALLQTISTKLQHSNGQAIELEDLMKKNTSRKIAASKFYSLLCLKKNQCVDVVQKEPYGEIKIQAGPNIDMNMI